MPSLRTTVLAAVAVSVAVANTDYYIDPNSVDIGTRENWCDQATSACPLICTQFSSKSTMTDTCDAESLTYSCICGNGVTPYNISDYSSTIPYFTCTEYGTQCMNNCTATDNACQSACRQDHPCGSVDPMKLNNATETDKPTATGTSNPDATSSSSDDSGDDGNGIYHGLDQSGASSTPGAAAGGITVAALEASSAAISLALIAGVGIGAALL